MERMDRVVTLSHNTRTSDHPLKFEMFAEPLRNRKLDEIGLWPDSRD